MKFLNSVRNNLILFFQNIKNPKRYIIKMKYLQRPLFLLKLRRFLYKRYFIRSVDVSKEIVIENLFKFGITSFYDKDLSQTLIEISKDYQEITPDWWETSPGYLCKELPQQYIKKILPKVLPLADYYFGGNKLAKVRFHPTINHISRETVNSSSKTSSTDFWHIDTPNQLTMHFFCTDVNNQTPHLEYCGGIQNNNFIDLFNLTGNKNIFDFYKQLFTHKVKTAFGEAGTVSIFDPNGIHKDIIPNSSKKPRIYIHINFTPGNI